MAFQFRPGYWLSRFFSSLFWSLNILLVLYTGLIYWLLATLSVQHWTASFLMISLPLAWAGLIICGLFWAFSRSWRAVLPVLTLLAGFWLWPRTIAWHTQRSNLLGQPTLSLLSFNVQSFNINNDKEHFHPSQASRQLINWVISHHATVKCFQEFYQYKPQPTLQVIDRLRKAGYVYSASLHPELTEKVFGDIGVITFSKFPILSQGREDFGFTNGLVWADIKIGADTVRVINVHLQSMGIRVGRVVTQKKLEGVKQETRSVLGQLRFGFIERKNQVQVVERYVAESPYPVVVTGDFNETPYGVVYERMRQKLRNGFEDGGQGFGFTYNKPPHFIRIDHQFYDPRLTVFDFRTLTQQAHSDHYPIYGVYGLK
jgi:endonuclease/exonuclease/phosphatase family metal-dependent hydrolase